MGPKFTVFGIFAAASLVCAASISCSDDMGRGGVETVATEPVVAAPLSGEEAAVATFNEFMDIFLQSQAEQGETRSVASRPNVSNVRSTNSVAYGEPFSATRSMDSGIPVYELTLQSDDSIEGFAVVAEGDGLHNVIAYVPNGAIADTTFNAGLAMWFREMYAMGRDMQSDPETRANEWEDDWQAPDIWEPGWDITGNLYEVRTVEEYVRDMTPAERADGINAYWWGDISAYNPTTYYSPLLKTEWGQKWPYNYYMPDWKRDANGVMQPYSVGCAPLAVAQIMAFHKHAGESVYDWDLFTRTPAVTPYTAGAYQAADLIRDINVSLGARPISNSGSMYVSDTDRSVTATFNSYGYNSTKTVMNSSNILNTYNTTESLFPLIANHIHSKRPVLIEGYSGSFLVNIGHAWVADGYHIIWRWLYHEKGVGSNPARWEIWRRRYEIALIHFNWGWGGHGNGWYYSYRPHDTKTDLPSKNTYYQDKTIWTDIYPK